MPAWSTVLPALSCYRSIEEAPLDLTIHCTWWLHQVPCPLWLRIQEEWIIHVQSPEPVVHSIFFSGSHGACKRKQGKTDSCLCEKVENPDFKKCTLMPVTPKPLCAHIVFRIGGPVWESFSCDRLYSSVHHISTSVYYIIIYNCSNWCHYCHSRHYSPHCHDCPHCHS